MGWFFGRKEVIISPPPPFLYFENESIPGINLTLFFPQNAAAVTKGSR